MRFLALLILTPFLISTSHADSVEKAESSLMNRVGLRCIVDRHGTEFAFNPESHAIWLTQTNSDHGIPLAVGAWVTTVIPGLTQMRVEHGSERFIISLEEHGIFKKSADIKVFADFETHPGQKNLLRHQGHCYFE